jgi:hypothetical protein
MSPMCQMNCPIGHTKVLKHFLWGKFYFLHLPFVLLRKTGRCALAFQTKVFQAILPRAFTFIEILLYLALKSKDFGHTYVTVKHGWKLSAQQTFSLFSGIIKK